MNDNKSPTFWEDKLKEYTEQKRKEGMTFQNFFVMPRADGTTPSREELCEEIVRAMEAKDVEDTEVLGKYSKDLKL